jgi:hypothetical protein
MSENVYKGVGCLRHSDHYFYLALKPPVNSDVNFDEIASPAEHVRKLNEGSQVFVYPRENFGSVYDKWANKKEFQNFAIKLVGNLGGVVLDKVISNVSDKVEPEPQGPAVTFFTNPD